MEYDKICIALSVVLLLVVIYKIYVRLTDISTMRNNNASSNNQYFNSKSAVDLNDLEDMSTVSKTDQINKAFDFLENHAPGWKTDFSIGLNNYVASGTTLFSSSNSDNSNYELESSIQDDNNSFLKNTDPSVTSVSMNNSYLGDKPPRVENLTINYGDAHGYSTI